MNRIVDEIPMARILEDVEVIDSLPAVIRHLVTKVMADTCDLAGCGRQLYACIENGFFCEEHTALYVHAADQWMLDGQAFRITR